MQPAQIAGASRDGSIVYFFSRELTDDSDEPGVKYLYRYMVDSEDLKLITPVVVPLAGASPEAVPRQVSADGSTVYFQSDNALTPDARRDRMNFYVWRNDSLSLVASLDRLRESAIVTRFANWASPSGRYFVFESATNLTGYDTGSCRNFNNGDAPPCTEVYRFDADLKQLICASCPPTGGLAHGSANIGTGADEMSDEQIPRAVNDAGQVFFDTPEQLVQTDTNASEDVYEYDSGNVRLISPGRGEKSQLAGVSRDGRDVFFTTTNRLVRADVDKANDVYDARIGGGIASQNLEAPSPDCFGDDCRGLPPVPPAPPPGGSETTFAPGTQSARKKARCPRGRKARRVKGKQRCVKQSKKNGKASKNRRQGR
jgi:hypothetical protein